MRVIYLLFLVAFAGAVGYFAFLNSQEVELRFLNFDGRYSLAAVVGAAYGLGMLSGWTVVGLIRSMLRRATEPGDQR